MIYSIYQIQKQNNLYQYCDVKLNSRYMILSLIININIMLLLSILSIIVGKTLVYLYHFMRN